MRVFKIILVVILIIAVAGLIAYAGYLAGFNKSQQTKATASSTPTAIQTVSLQNTVTPKTSTTATASDESLIKQKMAEKFDTDASRVSIEFTNKDDNYALGTAGIEGEMGGGWFVAAKQDGEWLIIADGNGVIECAVLEEYDVPNTIVAECFNTATGENITR